MRDILEYFPYPSIRPSQVTVLNWVQANWEKHDVMVLQCPVAAGKSVIAVTIGKWAHDRYGSICGITTPDNVLVGQYKGDFQIPTLLKKTQYASAASFYRARDKFKEEPLKVMNNWTLLSSRAYSDVQIMDEAHQLIPMLQDMEGMKLWKHIWGYPDSLRTVADLLLWVATQDQTDPGMKKVSKLLTKNPDNYIVAHEKDFYRGEIKDSMRIYPLTPKDNKPILWPISKVKKLILMSATIAAPDVEDLGLHRRRVGYIEVPSDIPLTRRPWRYVGQGSMGRKSKGKNVGRCLDYLRRCHESQDGRGFIHATYGLASALEREDSTGLFRYHSLSSKKWELSDWLTGKDSKSFVGCGLTTGLNLKGNVCKWQAIVKCQFPDLSDPAVAAKAEANPQWYAWTTIKQIVQAYGRVCRSPDDYGMTLVLDSDFIKVYNDHRELFPAWFKEAQQ